eukprot:gene36169-43868_t
MEAINALHDQVCTIEKDLQRWQDEKEKQQKRLVELQAFKDQNIKRVANLGSCIEQTRVELASSNGQVENIVTESSQLHAKIEEQERILTTVPKLLTEYTVSHQNFCAQYRQEIKNLYEDMSKAKGYSQTLQDLYDAMRKNQATWKLREMQRESYRSMMMIKAKDDVSKETKELSSLLTQLQSLKRLHPALPYSVPRAPNAFPSAQVNAPTGFNGEMNNKRASSSSHYPPPARPYIVPTQPARHPVLTTNPQPPSHLRSGSMPAVNADADDDIIELDTDNYRNNANASHSTISIPEETNLHNTSITATRATVIGENSIVQIQSYEMSVSPWFQDRKRRKIDIYSLQDNFQ